MGRGIRVAGAGAGLQGRALLQRVGDVEDHRAIAGNLFHDAEAQHVHHQVVVAEAGAAVAQDDLLVARLGELVDDVEHLRGAEELRFLDVDDAAGLGQRHHQVGLASQERRQLQDVGDFGHGGRLPGFVHVGDHRHAEVLLDRLEDLHALFQARTAVGMDRRAVGLVERRLENVGDAQLGGHALVFLAGAQREILGFQHVDPAEQHEGLVVGAGDRGRDDDFRGGHGGAIL